MSGVLMGTVRIICAKEILEYTFALLRMHTAPYERTVALQIYKVAVLQSLSIKDASG
jgi:hypothetical protein